MNSMNRTISSNVLKLLRKNGKKQNELADAIGVSKQVMSNMMNGNRIINATELSLIASFFNVKMEDLMRSSEYNREENALHAFMGEDQSPEAKESLEIANRLAKMILYYARLCNNAEEMNRSWEA